MVYVRQEALPGLKKYKYSGVDHSLLSRYVLKPFYTNFVIKCFPMSMAPNLITLTDLRCGRWNTSEAHTHQSGPLGELFDHGVDAVNTSLECLIFAASQNLGMGWKTVMVLFASLLTFYVQTWDEYHTKTLTLGLISGPVEGIVILITVYAFTAIKGGASFWAQSMFRTVGIPHYEFIPDYIYELPFNEWYIWSKVQLCWFSILFKAP
ncbi:hypothetical protein DID88_002910 [Monilinia fructigena]|uniref:Uncharacterized protein n=1 Tax=Monilinia fructigena TaxID=38457 RepID=A0A395INH5_9HELO|nr:hypothetical protein DID88_002910 [Monilinia fructigena]